MSEIVKEISDVERIAMLEKQLETQQKQMEALLAALKATTGAPAPSTNAEKISIVHLVERQPPCSTYIELSNLVISMTHFGEERTLSVQQFEELLSRYRGWFDMGIIAVGADYEEQAKHYGLSTSKKYPMNSEFMKNLGSVPMNQLEDTFARLPIAGQESILALWNREVHKDNPAFKDIRKLETLNRVSGGKMSQLISELNMEDRKQNK